MSGDTEQLIASLFVSGAVILNWNKQTVRSLLQGGHCCPSFWQGVEAWV